jgi:multidrug efflux pump
MAHFFIDRPVFAWVISIVIMLAGGLAVLTLPVSMYPTIAPPTIEVRATYPGASAAVVENSVTQIIEENMTGLDGLIYFSSSSADNGVATITLTFANGTDPDIAQVQVQNKLQLALPLLPQEVQAQGINVNKSSSGFLQVVGFVSSDGSMSRADIADYITSNIAQPLSRVQGVGNVQVFGAKYAMRIWLDPVRLETYALSTDEVIAAIRAQNAQVAVGQLGGTPIEDGQQINAAITGQGRLSSVTEFEQIILRGNEDGSTLTLSDVARIELGAENYEFYPTYNRAPATGVGIFLATGANALETAEAVADLLDELRPYFPEGLVTETPFDTTPFVRVSISGVVKTLAEAIGLVFLVMFLFLQNLRATFIPTIAVPVVLLGTFGVLAALGFSINMLTMFAMVLAIGLLVDDAIVVVENVERIMREEGLSPREATRKSMTQITGALVGIGLVLSAVFVPMAFLSGSTGVIYRQFSATIVSAMALSVLVAIVLSPALCATLLKPVSQGENHDGPRFFRGFNRQFERATLAYQRGVGGILTRKLRFCLLFLSLCAVMAFLYLRLPSAFLPMEDQGVLFTEVTTPVGSTRERTLESIAAVEDHFLNSESDLVQSVFSVQGFSFAGQGQNTGMAFVKLKDWSLREGEGEDASAVAARASAAWNNIVDANVFSFAPPAMPELGTASGFSAYLKDNANLGHDALTEALQGLLAAGNGDPRLVNLRHNGQSDQPKFRIDIDTERASALDLSLATINSTLSTAWGGRYIDDFMHAGRIKRVYIQADAPYRMQPGDFARWSVKNRREEMVPFGAFATGRWDYGSPRLERYNGTPAVAIQGEAAPGVSTGEAMDLLEQLAGDLAPGFGIEWTGLSYQERQAGAQLPLLYTLSLLVVFLCLAALYESWRVPSAVILVAPLGILGTLLANTLRGMEQDIYFQVAMLTTVGLTSKNAILIVEFAKRYYEEGHTLMESTLAAVKDRLRPIVMTSLAFGFGVLPLAIASGAGSGAQQAIGTGVLGGMLVGTGLGLFFIPLFFFLVQGGAWQAGKNAGTDGG